MRPIQEGSERGHLVRRQVGTVGKSNKRNRVMTVQKGQG